MAAIGAGVALPRGLAGAHGLAEAVEALRRRHHLPPRYFAAVGNEKPHKNLKLLAELAPRLPAPIVLVAGTGTAKALGFPRQIAHGMWSKARCIAAIENRLPDAVRVEVAFKKPILLPGKVSFGTAATDDGHTFSLTSPKDGSPHLLGRATNL